MDCLLVSSFAAILLSFSECFTAPTFETFKVLVLGWVACPCRRTLTRVLVAGGGLSRRSFECYHRFFSQARWNVDDLSRVLFRLCLDLVPKSTRLTFAVDDTLTRKGGVWIWGAAMHHDPLRSTSNHKEFSFGHSWVVLSLQISLPFLGGRTIGVPILFRLYRKRVKRGRPPKPCNRRQTGGAKAHEYRTRPELAVEMLELLSTWLPDRELDVVVDMEYGGKSVLRHLPPNVHLTSRMPMDAALYEQAKPAPGRVGRPRKKGNRLPCPKKKAAQRKSQWQEVVVEIYGKRVTLLTKQFQALWYRSAGQRLLNIVITRDPRGRWQDRCYFSTRLDDSPKQIMERVSKRWSLEVTFHDAKQFLGLEDPQNRTDNAVQRTVPFVLITYALIVVWYAKHGTFNVEAYRRARPWYRKKDRPSFEDMLESLRAQSKAEQNSRHPVSDARLHQNYLPHDEDLQAIYANVA